MTDAREGTGRTNKSAFEVKRISSWEQLNETVFSQGYKNWLFRGHSDARWKLESTLGRRFKNAGIGPKSWPKQERRILNLFKRKAHQFLDHLPYEGDWFHWLAVMQHHGAPTRLLDFTYSPYVAAFFALDTAAADSAIWAVNQEKLILPFRIRTDRGTKAINPESFSPHEPASYEKHFLKNRGSFVIWDTPYIMNQRLIAQSGTFLIPSTVAEPVEEILSRYVTSDLLVKFVLETDKLRKVVMYELYRMNITHYTLFPGLDGLARSLGYEAEYERDYVKHSRVAQRPGWMEFF